MNCPHASEIKAKLLLPCHRTLLQKYIDRWKADPKFLAYHHGSTMLALRHELGYVHMAGGSCAKCDYESLMDCRMTRVLEEAMSERITEQESEILQK